MKIVITALALFLASMASASQINQIVVFGDSLSDNGNFYEYMKRQFPQDPPYYKGRFSNGPVWIERVATAYYPDASESHLFDYAFGGAGVLDEGEEESALFTLQKEVNSYLLAHQDKADEKSLFVVWIGANNYLALPEDSEQSLNIVKNGIKKEINRLVDKGAKHFLLVNLPDLGKTPSAYDFSATEQLSYLSSTHNAWLKNYVTELQGAHPSVQWLYLDVGQIFTDVIDFPESYGFSKEKLKGTCYDLASDDNPKPGIMKLVSRVKPTLNANSDLCEGYLFFDPVHPTASAHKILGEIAKQLLDEAGIEFVG